jgi:hypothetical protein
MTAQDRGAVGGSSTTAGSFEPLENVGYGAERAERVPGTEDKPKCSETKGDAGATAVRRGAPERIAEARGGDGHGYRRKQGEDRERGDRSAVIPDGRNQQDPHAGRPRDPVHRPDGVCLEGRAPERGEVPVIMRGGSTPVGRRILPVRVKMPMYYVVMATGVSMEVASAPAQQEAQAERHDHHPNQYLGRLLGRFGEIALKEDDRQSHHEERRGMANPPEQAEHAPAPNGVLLLGCDKCRDSREVIGVDGVPESEQDGQRDDDDRLFAVAQGGDALV